MKLNLSNVHDKKYLASASIPQGWYTCRVAEVRFRTNRAGENALAVRLEVCEGEYLGRTAAWDTFHLEGSGPRMARTKRSLRAMGVDVDGDGDVDLPEAVMGKQVNVLVLARSVPDPLTGQERDWCSSSVAFFGYEKAGASGVDAEQALGRKEARP